MVCEHSKLGAFDRISHDNASPHGAILALSPTALRRELRGLAQARRHELTADAVVDGQRVNFIVVEDVQNDNVEVGLRLTYSSVFPSFLVLGPLLTCCLISVPSMLTPKVIPPARSLGMLPVTGIFTGYS